MKALTRTIITTALAAGALCAQADADPWTVTVAKNGGSFTVLPVTARQYTTRDGGAQVDALVDFRLGSEFTRSRIGVTGCVVGMGQTAKVNPAGAAIGDIYEWTASGDRVFDGVAQRICAAAAAKYGSRSSQTPLDPAAAI